MFATVLVFEANVVLELGYFSQRFYPIPIIQTGIF